MDTRDGRGANRRPANRPDRGPRGASRPPGRPAAPKLRERPSRHAEALLAEWGRATGLLLPTVSNPSRAFPQRGGTRDDRNLRWAVVSVVTAALERGIPVEHVLAALEECQAASDWRARVDILRSRLAPKRETGWAQK